MDFRFENQIIGDLFQDVSVENWITTVDELKISFPEYQNVEWGMLPSTDRIIGFFALLKNGNCVTLNSGTHFITHSSKSSRSSFVLSTSGTTGKPKQVVYLAEEMITSIRKKTAKNSLKSLCLLPLHHIGGVNSLLQHVFRGASIWFAAVNQLTPEVVDFAKQKGINQIIASPSILRMLRHLVNQPFAGIETVRLGGEPLDENTEEIAAALFPNAQCVNMFGLTEAGILPQNPFGKDLSLKRENFKIVNGNLFVRRPAYISSIESDSEWIDTGDLAEFSENSLKIKGRADDQLSINGEKWSKSLLTKAILSLDSVMDVVISKKNNPLFGEYLHCEVLSPTLNEVELKKEIRNIVYEKVGPKAVPATIEIGKEGKFKFLSISG